MVQDVVGEPLGDEDKLSAIDTADDFNSGGFRVDPAEGQFFEGDISGVQLKAVDVKSDFDGQLTFGKVSARPILLTLYFTITLIPLGGIDMKSCLIFQNAIKNTYKLWPNGQVPYVISNKYSASERGVINSAISEMGRIRYYLLVCFNHYEYKISDILPNSLSIVLVSAALSGSPEPTRRTMSIS